MAKLQPRKKYLIGFIILLIAPVPIIPLVFSLTSNLAFLVSILIILGFTFAAFIFIYQADRVGGIKKPLSHYMAVYISWIMSNFAIFPLYLIYGSITPSFLLILLQGLLWILFYGMIKWLLGMLGRIKKNKEIEDGATAQPNNLKHDVDLENDVSISP